MKRTAIITGIATIVSIALGAFAKTMHWPGAGILITLGVFILVFIFAPSALRNNFKQTTFKSTFFYICVYLTAASIFISALFKLMHWPGAGILLIISMLFPFVVLIPAMLFYNKKNKSFTISSLIIILLFLAYTGVTATFLSLNISKDMIDEAVIMQKEMQSLSELTNKFNNEIKINNSDDGLILAAEKAKGEIDMLTGNILKVHQPESLTEQLQNPFKIPEKDGMDVALSVFLHDDSVIINYINKISRFYNELSNLSGFENYKTLTNQEIQRDLYFIKAENPKIWSIANLTTMKSQIEIQEYLYLKDKILKNTP